MLTNYLKIAWRNLYFNRRLNAVSIVGLAMGLAVTLLIVLYIAHEYSYDRFHQKAGQIVKVELKHIDSASSYSIPWMSYRFGEAVKNACPEVADFARFHTENSGSRLVQSNDRHKFFEANFCFADAGFVRLFDFPFVKGDPKTALTRPATVLLTEQMAHKYFGNADPLGRTIQYTNRFNKKMLFEVVGVLENPPRNSTIQFDFVAQIDASRAIDRDNVATFLSREDAEKQLETVGAGGGYDTYLLLHPAVSSAKVAAKIPLLVSKNERTKDPKDTYNLYPLPDLHFTVASPSAKQRTSLFGVVAIFVLVLALINFINLATARSINRAKEVSVRKVAGAVRSSLIAQFYVESALQVMLAFGLSVVLFVSLQPFFLDVLGLPIDQTFLSSAFFIVPASVLSVGCVLLSGSYPALLLSGFSPIYGLKNKVGSQQNTGRIRAGLTVFQFVVSVTLIIGSIIIKMQLDLFLKKDVGINRERVLTIPLNQEEGMAKHYTSIREAIGRLPGVENVTASSLVMYGNYMNGWDINRLGSPQKVSVSTFAVDAEFIPTMNVKWAIKPRPKQTLSTNGQIVINEAAARQLGINQSNYQQTLDLGGDTRKELVGVVKDFNYMSLERGIKPMAFFVANSDTTFRDYLYVKLAKNAPIDQTLSRIRRVYDRYKTERPFDYTFLEETYRNLYKDQISTGQIITAFTGFAIFIACLGLFGLAAFTAEQRTKEIGVRKVLGASVGSIVTLLSKDFLKLVLIAIVIASPLAWYAMHRWLKDFAYKIDIEWWYFALSGLLAVGIALLTVSFQSVKAALMNPVKSLRSE